MTTKSLTEEQYAAACDKLGSMLRATKLGTPEREEVEIINSVWEQAHRLQERTVLEREFRRGVLADLAEKYGLVP